MSSFSLSPATDIRSALLGGAVLGLSTTAYLALVGRVTGMSGSLRQTYLQLTSQKPMDPLHVVYVGGLLLGGVGVRLLTPQAFDQGGHGVPLMLASGLLVGVGTTVGHGCTSGHGLCGLARFSKRSVLAVATFFGTALATCTALAPFFAEAWVPSKRLPVPTPAGNNILPGVIAAGASLVAYGATQLPGMQTLIAATCSSTFAVGLALAGMTKSTKIHDFLALQNGWDPSLAFVMGGGLAVNVLLWPQIQKWEKPSHCPAFDLPSSTHLTFDLVVGGFLFGVGWAVGGLCPGPAIVGMAGPFGMSTLVWTIGCLAGQQATVSIRPLLEGKNL